MFVLNRVFRGEPTLQRQWKESVESIHPFRKGSRYELGILRLEKRGRKVFCLSEVNTKGFGNPIPNQEAESFTQSAG